MQIFYYDRINFTDGTHLSIPIVGTLYQESKTEMDFNCLNCIFAGQNDTIIGDVILKGLPLYPDKKIDMDGGEWYVQDKGGTNYYVHGGNLFQETIYLGTGVACSSGGLFLIGWTSNQMPDPDDNPRIGYCGYINSMYSAIDGMDGYAYPYDGPKRTWQAAKIENTGNAWNAYNFIGNFGFVQFYNGANSGVYMGTSTIGFESTIFEDKLPNSFEKYTGPDDKEPDSNIQGGTTTTGGGGGNFDKTSDVISIPSLPSLNATDCGFVTLYSPGRNTLISFCQFLWSDNIFTLLKNYFTDPVSIIIGLGIVPVQVSTSGLYIHKVGAVEFPVQMPLVSSQYQEYDCGSLSIDEFWGSSLDYAPYTQIQLYLPYIGVRELNTDEIMGKTIGVKYHIDLYGGGIIALVTVNGSVRYQFSGNCMQQIPISGANYNQMIANLVQLACVVGTGIAASGSAAGIAAEEASALGAGGGTLGLGMTDSAVVDASIAGAGSAAREWLGNNGSSLVSCTVNTVMSAKPRIERTGSLGAVTGQMGVQTPFLIITRPEQALPQDYRHFCGYPSNITSQLGSLEGYTEVENIRLNDIPATQPEIVEIYELLKRGVII